MQPIAKKKPKRQYLVGLNHWFVYKLFKVDTYESLKNEIISGRQRKPLFKIHNVVTWQQIFYDFGVSAIIVKFDGGQIMEYSDKHEDLFRILRLKVPEKELPWKAI